MTLGAFRGPFAAFKGPLGAFISSLGIDLQRLETHSDFLVAPSDRGTDEQTH